MDTVSLVKQCLAFDYFQANENGEIPIPVKFAPGEGKLVVAVGGNASGKSFFGRVVRGVCSKRQVECMSISMEGRRSVAYNIGLAFVYGSEDWQSTGVNSSNTVLGAIRTSLTREKEHVIFWDEPDIGLSDDWAASTGVEIRNFAQGAPERLVGAFVVTHSKALVRELLPANPHVLLFGEECLTEWLERPLRVQPISELGEKSYQRFKLIQAILDKKKRSK